MTEEKINIDDLVKEIENNVSSKLNAKIDEGVERLGTTIDMKFKKSDKEEDSFLDEDEESLPITGKELKNILSQEIPKVKKEVVDESLKGAEKLLDQRTNQQIGAVNAIRKFPQLDPNKPSYNPKFQQEVEKEIDRRISLGRSKNDPELLNDSAASIKLNWIDRGMWSDKSAAEKETELLNSQEDSFTFTPGNRLRSGRLSEDNFAYGMKLGLTKDRMKQLHEKYGKR